MLYVKKLGGKIPDRIAELHRPSRCSNDDCYTNIVIVLPAAYGKIDLQRLGRTTRGTK